MPKGNNQKLKLIYLIKILLSHTDEEHGITMADIMRELSHYQVTAERKSIYSDFELIRTLGMDVIGEKRGREYYYHLTHRPFEIVELKLLVDVIQSSKFITARKSNELIKKLEGMASIYEAQMLQRQVYVGGRIKTMNESIYYNVDEIHNAIGSNRQIRFRYFQWNVKKEMELRRDGEFYVVSPWALSWDDENYYMIAYDSEAGIIKHYRVDKMLELGCVERPREGREYFERFDMAVYARKSFRMFGGEEQHVKLEFENRLAGVVIDRFGSDITMRASDENHFIVHANVAVSDPFFGWIFALGKGARILGPENVVQQMTQALQAQQELYEVSCAPIIKHL